MPIGSSRPAPPRLSRTRASTGSSSRPIGTLTQKIHCQDEYCGDRAADDRAERDAEAAHRAPDAERDAAPLRRHHAGQQRQRQRHHDRAAEALHRPGRDQHADVRRQRGGRPRPA